MIDAYAAVPADVTDLAPVWWGLPAEDRGAFTAHQSAIVSARREGLWPLAQGAPARDADDPLLVTHRAPLSDRRLVILDGTFSEGGKEPDLGHLILSATPLRTRGEPVGRPALDRLPLTVVARTTARPIVAYVLGPIDRTIPEAPEVLDAWVGAVQSLVAWTRRAGTSLFLHSGCESAFPLCDRAEAFRVPFVWDFRTILSVADVLVSDDRDRLTEFAALRGPVVALESPFYPRPLPDGAGVSVSHPDAVVAGVEEALAETAGMALRRRRYVERTYPLADGHATARAVDAVRLYVL